MADKPKTPTPGIEQTAYTFNVWSTAGDIGVKLALPLLIFLLAGIKLDKKFGTTPLLTISGMLLAFFVSIVLIYKLIKRINDMQPKVGP